MFYLVLLLLLLPLNATSQSGPSNWTAFPFSPPALPLAVRSPYLNIWITQGNNPRPAFIVDNTLWDTKVVVQWYVSVVVDDTEYRMLSPWADGEKTVNQTAVEFTATRTSFLMTAATVQFNMTFLSPIEPNNLTLQSLPFAYLYITAESMDGQPHRVRMYSDIEGGLAAGNPHQTVQWTSEDTTDYVILGIQLQDQRTFVEDDDIAQDSTVYYSFKKIQGYSTEWTITGMNSARGRFFANPSGGHISNSQEPASKFRPPSSGDDTPCFGVSIDWGNITSTPEPAVWSLGVFRDPSVEYRAPSGSFESRSPYFVSEISLPLDVVKFVLDDFPRAMLAAETFDSQIRTAGESISTEYANLLALSSRQAMGSMDITIPPATDGVWDTSDVKIFMKNIGSTGSDSGTSASVNTVDALYASFPVFLYLNPDIGGYLLDPLLEYQDSAAYSLPYAAKNIGPTYPRATSGDINQPHPYGIDESAGMLIMSLAYSLASGNGTLVAKHYNLLRNWAEYLVNNTISPSDQASSDFGTDFIMSNQTNLALKGIIAVAAMARISEIAGNGDDMQKFNEAATSGINFWQEQALSPSHVNFVYGASDTNSLIYNAYADRLLHLDLVPEDVYTLLTTSYQTAANQAKYGIPLNNSPNQNTSTNWMMFAASTMTDNATRNQLVSQIHAYASNNLNKFPFASIYDPSTGLGATDPNSGIARIPSPAQGGMFALLAMDKTNNVVAFPSVGSTVNEQKQHKPSTGALVGGVIGGVIFACCVIFAFFFMRRRFRDRRRTRPNLGEEVVSFTQTTQPYILPPSFPDGYSLPSDPSNPEPSSLHQSNAALTSRPYRSAQAAMQPYSGSGQLEYKCERTGVDSSGSPLPTSLVSTSDAAPRTEISNNSADDRQHRVDALHNEVFELRRDLEQIRREHLADDAPPLYSEPI
ncbi:hypothetical protein ACEPAF_163 [Sanghuangporus sanghuang]